VPLLLFIASIIIPDVVIKIQGFELKGELTHATLRVQYFAFHLIVWIVHQSNYVVLSQNKSVPQALSQLSTIACDTRVLTYVNLSVYFKLASKITKPEYLLLRCQHVDKRAIWVARLVLIRDRVLQNLIFGSENDFCRGQLVHIGHLNQLLAAKLVHFPEKHLLSRSPFQCQRKHSESFMM
jgi:hypothetical protein